MRLATLNFSHHIFGEWFLFGVGKIIVQAKWFEDVEDECPYVCGNTSRSMWGIFVCGKFAMISVRRNYVWLGPMQIVFNIIQQGAFHTWFVLEGNGWNMWPIHVDAWVPDLILGMSRLKTIQYKWTTVRKTHGMLDVWPSIPIGHTGIDYMTYG